MRRILLRSLTTGKAQALALAFLLAASAFLSRPLAAQQSEPQPPPSSEATPPKAIVPAPAPGGISTAPPSIPVDQVIQQFAARETEFKTERDNFTYVQTFVVQTIDDNGKPDGEYRMTSDIIFTTSGQRYENITYAPAPTL